MSIVHRYPKNVIILEIHDVRLHLWVKLKSANKSIFLELSFVYKIDKKAKSAPWGFNKRRSFVATDKLTAEKILYPKDAGRLLKLLKHESEKSLSSGKDLSYVTDYYMVAIAYNTGLRRLEVHNLNWGHVKDEFLVVKNSKFNKSRTVFFGDKTACLFREFRKFKEQIAFHPLEENSPVVLGQKGRLSTTHIHRRFKLWVEKAGINKGEISFHSLRHGYATRMIEEGVSLPLLRDQLGHKDISTTSVYLHFTAKAKEVLCRAT